MEKGPIILISMTIGAVIGVAASASYFKTKYETLADEEISAMKEYYENLKADVESSKKRIKVVVEDDGPAKTLDELVAPKLPEYGSMFKHTEVAKEPYIITPEDFFDEQDGREKISLTYYLKDRILTDDNDCMLEDIASAVGSVWEEHFGEYVANVVYVRNDVRQCDYEIAEVDSAFNPEYDD